MTLDWNKILSIVLRMPGVRVDRIAFLRDELKGHCNQQKLDMLANVRPYALVTDEVINSIADSCINRHTALATTGSTIAGLPGGLAMAATIPGDITQYFFHVVVLSQKLAYLYGFPDLCNEEGELSEEATDLLTIFMGSMMGVRVADQGISELAKGLATSAVSRLPRVAISKIAIYPIAMQVAKLVGTKLTKDGFAKSVGKFIPIAGGVFSGTLTLLTFRPGARRLKKRLQAQKRHFSHEEITDYDYSNIRATFVKAEQTQNNPKGVQLAIAQAMVNMANLCDDPTTEVQDLIEERIAMTELPDHEQIELLEYLGTEFSFDIDYDLLSCDPDISREALRGMIAVMNAAGRKTMAEKMYLSMAAKTLGITKEELEKMMQEA